MENSWEEEQTDRLREGQKQTNIRHRETTNGRENKETNITEHFPEYKRTE